MVSYELAMGLSAVVIFLMSGSVSLREIVGQQAGAIWNWNVFSVPGFIAFILFWTAAFAETNRTPFDLPEGEAELVGGYHTEYSSLRFALFFMAEYANMIVASAVTATLFFGGYNVPFLDGAALRENASTLVTLVGFGAVPPLLAFAAIAFKRRNRPFYRELKADDIRHREPLLWTGLWAALAVAHAGLGALGLSDIIGGSAVAQDIVALAFQLTSLTVKVLFGCWFFIWVRWTLPRFRYDQLMDLGWKRMLPIALANVFLAAVWLVVKNNLFPGS